MDSLKKFEGEYQIGQMNLKVFLKNETLHLFTQGQPEFELVPMDTNKFSLKDMNGFTIVFDVNEKNEVTGLTSHQPNGVFKAPKKKQ